MIVIFLTKKQGGVQLVQLSNCPTFSDQIAEDEWCDYLRHIIIFMMQSQQTRHLT